jgi:hypothetical protein
VLELDSTMSSHNSSSKRSSKSLKKYSNGIISNSKRSSSNHKNNDGIDNDSDVECVYQGQASKVAGGDGYATLPVQGGENSQESAGVLEVWENEVTHVHHEVIDISVGGGDDDCKQAALMQAYEKAVKKEIVGKGKGGRGKRGRSDVARAAVAPEDVVVIDGDDAASGRAGGKRRKTTGQQTTPGKGVDPEAEYFRVLGPLRMKFIESFTTRHSYAHIGSSTVHPKFDMNRTYKELMEYQLNLPVQLSSSIFVRALEGQINTIRVMITGKTDEGPGEGVMLRDVDDDDDADAVVIAR